MSLENPMRQWFVAGTKISSRFPFEGYSIAPVKIVVVLASNSGSDDHDEDCSPHVRERNPKPPRPPKSHGAKVAPPPANGKGDCEDDRTRQKAVLR
jgi:hypothetical protein